MRSISVSNDIIPVGQFKASLAKYLKEVQENQSSLIIAQNGKPAGVLISPSEFDELKQTKLFIDSISRGLSDTEEVKTYTTFKLKDELKKIRKKKQK